MGVDNGTGCKRTENKEMNTMDRPNPRLQIRKLPYRIHRELSRLLDIPGDKDWKALVAVLPDGMYSRDQVETLRNVGRNNGSPAEELLRDLGYQLITVRELIGYLAKLNHQEALLLLKPTEPVEIIMQPESASVLEGDNFVLTCGAKGFPKPSFQWFKVGYGEVETGIEKDLHFECIGLEDFGSYYCQVSNEVNIISSNTVNIQVIPSVNQLLHAANETVQVGNSRRRPGPSPYLLRNDAMEPREVYPGQYFVLSCGVDDLPNVSYHWLKDGSEIPGENSPKLVFNPFWPEDEGYYSCRVVGQEGDMLTKLMHLKVGSLNLEDRQIATGKVALIIGNQNYSFKRAPNLELVHPVDDARTLGAVLREMGYRVICLVDLDKAEMERAIERFCEMLSMSPGMYGIFYFGGHGYEENGKTYLVPVDAPSNWNAECTIRADHVLSEMQKSKTKLNVLILDVCRTPAGNDPSSNGAKSFDPYFIPGAQSVICYATCPQSQAFERRSDRNGIYMKHLMRHIHDDKRIENVIFDVHRDVSRETEKCVLTKTMSPTYTSSTTKEFRLLDPVSHILTGDPTEKWFQHHRLPSSQILVFDNGIKTKLSFDPICSNLCYLILHVEDTGSTSECDVMLFEISKDIKVEEEDMNIRSIVDSDLLARSNPDTLHPTGKPLPFERRTRLPNLQKIMGKLMLTLEAVYKVNEKDRKENKCLIIEKSEFGITSLFESKK